MIKSKLSLLLVLVYSFLSAQKRDSIHIPFPEKYHLTLKYHQENETIDFKEWIPKTETFENYNIIATLVTTKGKHNLPIQSYKDILYKTFQERATGVKFTDLAKNKEGEREYLIFKSEVEAYKEKPDFQEAQIYFLTKGDNDFLVGIIALKKKKLPETFINEWVKVFQNSKLIK